MCLFHIYSILTEERFERLAKQINYMDLESPVSCSMSDMLDKRAGQSSVEDGGNTQSRTAEASQPSTFCSLSERPPNNISNFEQNSLEGNDCSKKEAGNNDHVPLTPETEMCASHGGENAAKSSVDHNFTNRELSDRCVPKAVLPLIQFQQGESSDSSSRYIIILQLLEMITYLSF